MKVLATVLFLALCAWLGARLWTSVGEGLETVAARYETVTDSVHLRGIVVRREQLVCAAFGDSLTAENGQRLPGGSAVLLHWDGSAFKSPCSAVFYADFDGFEALSPDMLENLSVSGLDELLATVPEDTKAHGRLVCDFAWYFAAFVPEEIELAEGERCRLRFENTQEKLEAVPISLSESERGERAAVFRLTEGDGQYLSLRGCDAELFFDEYSGLSVPTAAIIRENDSHYVYTLSAGVVEQCKVDIIYTAEDFCLVSPESLHRGSTLILPTEDIYTGKVIS